MKNDKDAKPSRLKNAPLEYAPENELGVVFLFAALAKRWGLRVESVRPGFPDCIAYQRTGTGDNKRKRIEFEFYSSNFKTHGHDPKGCDWIVCWEHDWHAVPPGIEVIELRREFGLGFNVWVQPVGDEYKERLTKAKSGSWSVPGRASVGDLLLFYRTSPDMCIRDVFKMTGKVEPCPEWKYGASIGRVCRLEAPVFLEVTCPR